MIWPDLNIGQREDILRNQLKEKKNYISNFQEDHMKINENQITKVSNLARLELNNEEKSEFTRQLSDIISYVEKINELDTDSIKPADHIEDSKNVMRKDKSEKSLLREKIEKVAPSFDEGHFIVPKIIE